MCEIRKNLDVKKKGLPQISINKKRRVGCKREKIKRKKENLLMEELGKINSEVTKKILSIS